LRGLKNAGTGRKYLSKPITEVYASFERVSGYKLAARKSLEQENYERMLTVEYV
jgi:hypothetical protein